MSSFLAPLFRFFRADSQVAANSPAAALMESADARAGLDPRHAYELRQAASAWLSVVR